MGNTDEARFVEAGPSSEGMEDGTQDEPPPYEEAVPEVTYDGPACCHPNSYFQKGVAIILMCFLCFGSYFLYDTPGALINEFESTMGITELQIGLLNSLYSWPNVVLPVVGGYLIDKVFGLRVSAVIFSSFVVLGNYLTAVGAFVDSFILMEISRFIFGVGGESLGVAVNTYASAWFKGEALNMVFGLQLSMARVGSTLTFQASQPLYNATYDLTNDANQALGYTLTIASLTCILSFGCAILLGFVDWRKSKLTGGHLEEQPEIHLKDIFIFPLSLWLVCVICVAFYITIFPFVSFGKKFYMEKFDFTATEANFINGLIYLISAGASPVLGFVIDRIGLNIYFVLLANICTVTGHTLLGFTMLNPYVGVSLLGAGYSLLAGSLWPLIALILPLHRQGTAFGVVQAIQNLGLSVVSILAGYILDNFGYTKYEIFNVGCLGLSILSTVLLYFANRRYHHNYLNMMTKERTPYEESDEYKTMMRRLGGERD